MSLPVRFSQLNLSSDDGSNWGYLKSASTTNNLELKPADGSSVVVDAPLFYKNSSDVSTALNATLDSFAASIATSATQVYIDAQDAVLQANIDSEESARISSDGVLQENIDAEAATRAAADFALDVRVAAIETLLSQLGSATP
jgi:hypothetical protein